jgi:hypothetical protein
LLLPFQLVGRRTGHAQSERRPVDRGLAWRAGMRAQHRLLVGVLA